MAPRDPVPLAIELLAFARGGLCDAVEQSLTALGHRVQRASSTSAATSQLSVLVVGAPMAAGGDAVSALRERAEWPCLGLVDAAQLQSASELIGCCSEVALWPCAQQELAMRLRRIAPAPGPVETPSDGFLQGVGRLNLIGASDSFLALLRRLERFATCDAPVLLEGETGTGKELAARAVHYHSRRHDQPFIPINCGALPEHLIENELFGHEKGAFTGAVTRQSGLVEQARGGTLFLDEVEALTPRAQVSLLRFLQEQEYRHLGGQQIQHGDVRLIAASNAGLAALVGQGQFREDFLFRLNVLFVRLPPLRERRDDIRLLAGHFLGRLQGRYGGIRRRLDAATLAWMERYAWPGNVRELENFLHREFVLADGPVIDSRPPGAAGAGADADADVGPGAATFDAGFQQAKALAIDAFEHRYLDWLMAECGGNVTVAARRAGKERRALGKLLRKHHIDRSRYCG